jgi:hypothetical protein
MARKTIWILAILACLSTSLFAQITGDIFVTVTDRSGAVIPNATITLKNLETGAVRTATTAGDGSVRFTLLNTGRYEVQAEAGGFGGAKSQTNVSSGQVQELKFGLEVATTRQEVVVTDSAVQINTVNAQLATTTTTKEVANLPLNTSTAGILGLAQTAPGVSPFPPQDNNGFQGFGNFNVNGGRGRGNNITLDNATATDVSISGSVGLGTVPLDGIQEVNFITNNFSAEFGRNANSQFQIITKSGSNEFHGSVFEFFRNDKLNARDYFDRTGKATITRDNRFGTALGGRLIKDKLFWFGTGEWNYIRGAGGTRIATVPTPAQVASITDPTSRRLWEASNGVSSPSGTVSNQAPNFTDSWAYSAKINWNISEKDSFFGRIGQNDTAGTNTGLTFVSSNLLGNGALLAGRDTNATASYTRTFTPRMVYNFLASYGRSTPDFAAAATNLQPYINFLDATADLNTWTGGPQGRTQNTYQYLNTVTYTLGTHTFKGGYEFNRIQSNSYFESVVRGQYNFANFAAFAAGTPTSYSQRFGNSVRGTRVSSHFAFFQDDWRVSRTLTLNLGLRFEGNLGATEVNGILSNLNLNSTAAMGGAGTGPLGAFEVVDKASQNQYNWAPRVGLSWNPGGGKWAIRTGYGLAYDFAFLNPITNLRFAPPFMYLLTESAFQGGNSYAALANYSAPFQASGQALVGSFGTTIRNFGSVAAVDQNLRNPQIHQWNFTVERDLAGIVMRAGYVGTKSNYLQLTRTPNTVPASQIPVSNSPAEEQANLARYLAIQAGANPGPTQPTNRLDPRFGYLTLVESGGNANFHSFQFSAQKRFAKGFTFNAAYTWSKSIDNASDALGILINDVQVAQNPDNWRENRAVSAHDMPHRFVLSHVWDLPWFKNSDNGLLKHTLGGWQFSGIFQVNSGLPQNIITGQRLGLLDTSLRVNNPVANHTIRPNISGPLNFEFRPDPGAGANNPNLAANSGMTFPLLGQTGNMGRNVLRQNGMTLFDWTVGKEFRITERYRFQLQGQIFNVFNNTSFTLPGALLNTPANFGYYQATNTLSRNIQINARFLW